MANISAIILAAGRSVRMGEENKLLLPIKGKAIIQHMIDEVSASNCREVIVVTNNQTPIPSTGKIQIVENAKYKEGMTTSIQLGVEEADERTDGYMICLGDQPFIETGTYNEILNAFQKSKIVVPFYGKQKGNPVIFANNFKSDILQCPDPEGCKSVIATNKESVIKLSLDTSSILKDIDTLADYKKII